MMESNQSTSETDQTGRWGRTPYEPEDLIEQYGTDDRGTATRLNVTCPACEQEWHPLASCCVKSGSRTASPFCPDCGTDFRADPEHIVTIDRLTVDAHTDAAREALIEAIRENPGLDLANQKSRYSEADHSIDTGDEQSAEGGRDA